MSVGGPRSNVSRTFRIFFFSFGFEFGIFLLFSCIGIARVFFAILKRLLGNFPV